LNIHHIALHFLGIFKQVAYGACGTAVGGVFGGPVGAMVGGLAGKIYIYNICLSVIYILLLLDTLLCFM